MTFDRAARQQMLRENAAAYVDTAIGCILREYPVMPWYFETGPGRIPTHRESHPAFYGSLDWHSCVEMHWVATRLLRDFPDQVDAAKVRETVNSTVTPEHIAGEIASFDRFPGFERPYGWGWFLTFYYELVTWDDLDAQRWAETLKPLADYMVESFVTWLPALTYPHRTGLHPNTAFALSCSYNEAQRRAGLGDSRFLDAIHDAVGRWYIQDTDYPVHYEPSGADFLSAGLVEAELVSKILPPDQLPKWLTGFLPGLATSKPDILFNPVTVSDESDGQTAHLHGLNLSRAWVFVALADRLPAGDPRIAPMLDSARRHTEASIGQVSGSDYMVEHWLAVYALLLLTQ